MLENLTTKQKQRILVVAVAVIALGLIVVGSYFSEKKKETRIQEIAKRKESKMSLLTDKVEKDLWIAAEGQNIKALEKSNEELRFRLEQLTKELEETKKELKKREALVKIPPVPPPAPPSPKKPPAVEKTLEEFAKEEGFEVHPGEPFSKQKEKDLKAVKEKKAEPGGSAIRVFKEEEKREKDEKKKAREAKKEEGSWLPSGSFMKAVLLSGLDAPTAAESKSEPYPVLLGVTDLSVLPNRFRMNLRECFIIGAGFGNLSDERAYIRTENLSCVRLDGTVIDTALKGHVIGEDGKLGLRGRLVSKQGQKIAMALLAGTLSSFAHAFRPQTATVLSLSPEDEGVFRYRFRDVMEAGALGGVGNALNKIADYYLKMADKIFPIIEVDAGREVEIFILKGQELKIHGGKETKGK